MGTSHAWEGAIQPRQAAPVTPRQASSSHQLLTLRTPSRATGSRFPRESPQAAPRVPASPRELPRVPAGAARAMGCSTPRSRRGPGSVRSGYRHACARRDACACACHTRSTPGRSTPGGTASTCLPASAALQARMIRKADYPASWRDVFRPAFARAPLRTEPNTDTPLGLTPSGCSRPAGDDVRGGAETSQSGAAGRDGGLPTEACWRQGDGLGIRSTGERPTTHLPFERVDQTRGEAARANATRRPPDDWGCSPDACGGLLLSPFPSVAAAVAGTGDS
jgi:hypothetical protein